MKAHRTQKQAGLGVIVAHSFILILYLLLHNSLCTADKAVTKTDKIPALRELKFKWRRQTGVVSAMKKMTSGKVDEEGRGEELFR